MECSIFINEGFISSKEKCSEPEAVKSALAFVECIMKIISVRQDVKIVHFGKISSICISSYSLAELLRNTNSKEYWDRIRSTFENAFVYYADVFEELEQNQYVAINEITCRGALMTLVNQSVLLSFDFNNSYGTPIINAEHFTLLDDKINNVTIGNMSTPDHVDYHSLMLSNYGKVFASSSTIYANEKFIVQMYMNDHNPPHVHVYSSADKSLLLARVNIKNFDFLAGSEKVQPVRRELIDWLRSKQAELLENWSLCREGKSPMMV